MWFIVNAAPPKCVGTVGTHTVEQGMKWELVLYRGGGSDPLWDLLEPKNFEVFFTYFHGVLGGKVHKNAIFGIFKKYKKFDALH